MKPDPQKDAVYALDLEGLRGIWKGQKLSLKWRRVKFQELCEQYGVPHIPVVSLKLRGYGGAYCLDSVRLEFDPTYGADVITFAHEVAHYLRTSLHGFRGQDHGPLFVGYYAQILAQLNVMPLQGFRELCRRYKVKMTRAPI